MSELLPCPFCGGSAERIDIDDGENAGGSCISCTRCQASSNLEFGYKENFVSNWNRRAGPAMTPDLREAVADLLLNAGCGDSNECEAIADEILSLPALSVPEGWRPIETAPRDGTYVLALIGGADGHWAHLNGRAFVIRHEGKTPSGFDLGWALFPGFGGVGDHWLAGWMPLPTLSAIPSWGSSRPWPIDGTGNLGSAVASGDAGDATTEGGGA